MGQVHGKVGKARLAPMLLAVGLALGIPAAGLAVVGSDNVPAAAASPNFMPFTPANVDPALVQRIASTMGTDALRFTPASRISRGDRTLTVAVRVDEATAKAISVRSAIEGAQNAAGLGTPLALAASRYNLGIARGYESFAEPAPEAIDLPSGIREIAMPDLAEYGAAQKRGDKPNRFKPHISLKTGGTVGRSGGNLESLGEQILDLGGAYSVTRNIDVTAGVRLSEDRHGLGPLTNGVEDSQAVYVGTQLRF